MEGNWFCFIYYSYLVPKKTTSMQEHYMHKMFLVTETSALATLLYVRGWKQRNVLLGQFDYTVAAVSTRYYQILRVGRAFFFIVKTINNKYAGDPNLLKTSDLGRWVRMESNTLSSTIALILISTFLMSLSSMSKYQYLDLCQLDIYLGSQLQIQPHIPSSTFS